MTKEELKKAVIALLKQKGISYYAIRAYNSPRYGIEVRVYKEPQEFQNTKKSFRKTGTIKNEDGSITIEGMTGHFSRKISLYTAIDEKVIKDHKELAFTLECLSN